MADFSLVAVCALPTEAAALKGKFQDLQSHQLGSIQWYSGQLAHGDAAKSLLPQAIVITGMGGRRAAKALTTWLDEGNTAKVLVSFGFAGGLCSRAAAGSLWTASEYSAKDQPKTKLPISDSVKKVFNSENVQIGQLYGVGLPILRAADKQSAGEEFSATHCDMESHRILGVAKERDIAAVSLRSISDTVSETIPTWILELGRKSSAGANAKQAFSSCLKHPTQAMWLPTLAYRARRGSSRLATVIAKIASQTLA